MIKIAIIGDIGSGKSFVSKQFLYPGGHNNPLEHVLSYSFLYNENFSL